MRIQKPSFQKRTIQKLILLVLILSSPMLQALSYTTEISESELQSRLTKLMPITKKYFFSELTLFEPNIDLIGGNNQVSLSGKVILKLTNKLKAKGNVKIRGQLSYQPESGTFYFKEPMIEELVFDQLPEKYQAKARLIIQTGTVQILNKMPVYQLKDDKLSHAIAKSSLKSLVVKEDRLLVELALF